MQNRPATEDATAQFKPNGNGHHKAFILAPAPDERTRIIIEARTRLLEWPRRKKGLPGGLCDGEKALAAWIIDRALHPKHKDRDGVVTVSEKDLAETFERDRRTIQRWKANLIRITGEFWISKVFRPNMGAADCFHLTALDPKREKVQYQRDGFFGGKKLRGAIKRSDEFAFKPGQRSLGLKGVKSAKPEPKPADGFCETESGLWVPGFTQVSDAPLERRQPCRFPSDTSAASQATPVPLPKRQECRLPSDTDAANNRDSDRSVEAPLIKGEGNPPGDGFEQWALSLKTYLPSGLRTLKAELYARVRSSTDAERPDWQRRLDAVDERIFGRKLSNGSTPQAKPKPKTVSQIERLPTAEELAEGAAYAASIGKNNLVVTAEQLAALQKSGNHQ